MSQFIKKPFLGVKNAGFTLIELLVVVLIIGILAAVAVPQYEKAVWKSRSAALHLWAEKVFQAEEQYFLANGRYTQCLDRLDIDYSAAFPKVLEQGSSWYDGGLWANDCVLAVQTKEGSSPGMTLSLKAYFPRVMFASGKYERNGFGVYLSLDETKRKVGGVWGRCSGMGDMTGWHKMLVSMGYTQAVVSNYACYQQLNQ